MSLLDDRTRVDVSRELEKLQNEVTLVVFTQPHECQFCKENRQLAEELGELSARVKVVVYDFEMDREKADEYRVERIPAIVVVGDRNPGVRFFGLAAGYEFVSLLQGMIAVSNRDSGLKPSVRKALAKVDKPVHLQVFVTPTCPYCPRSVILAHQFAVESMHITADMIELTEFPELAQRYQVSGVPKTLINERFEVMGMADAETVLGQIQAALSESESASGVDGKDRN